MTKIVAQSATIWTYTFRVHSVRLWEFI